MYTQNPQKGSSRNHATEQNTFGTQIMFLSQKNLWTRGAKASKATPTWFPTLPEAPRLPLPPSKQPLKLPTTKNDLAATQELPDPFLPLFLGHSLQMMCGSIIVIVVIAIVIISKHCLLNASIIIIRSST